MLKKDDRSFLVNLARLPKNSVAEPGILYMFWIVYSHSNWAGHLQFAIETSQWRCLREWTMFPST